MEWVAIASALLGAASKAKGASMAGPSGASGGYATTAGTLDSSNWTVNIGGTSPGIQLAAGSAGILIVAALAAAGLVWLNKKS